MKKAIVLVCGVSLLLVVALLHLTGPVGSPAEDTGSTLNILLISDLHGSLASLEKLLQVAHQVDLVILCGDISSFDAEAPETAAQTTRAIDIWRRTFALMKRFNARVMYVPGNHDPLRFYSPEGAMDSATLLHGRVVPVARKLVAMGFGGAVAGLYEGNSSVAWPGFPFDETQMGKGVGDLMRQMQPDHQVLLVTHCGPAGVSTSVSNKYLEAVVQSGSKKLTHQLKRPSLQHSVILNVHGHTHVGFGLAHIGNTQIVNPGALKWGRYASVKLVWTQDAAAESWRWAVADTQFFLL